jgi:methanogenic corrinoid protein MtbC1
MTVDIPELSEQSLGRFEQALPALTDMVNRHFKLDCRYACVDSGPETDELFFDFHDLFGRMLRAVLRCRLGQSLDEEFGWYVSALRSRNVNVSYFARMLDAWVMSIHSLIEPADARLLAQPLTELKMNLDRHLAAPAPAEPILTPDQLQFLTLLLKRERRNSAEFALDRLGKGAAPLQVCERVILPVMTEVGRRWQLNRLGVTEEHASTDICRYVVSRLFDAAACEAPNGQRALVTCAPGEEHELGAEVMGNLLESRGWQVYLVGHNAPEKEILRADAQTKSLAVLISVSLIVNLPAALHLVDALKAVNGQNHIVVGGRGTGPARHLFQARGCPVAEDFEDGLRRVGEMAGKHA